MRRPRPNAAAVLTVAAFVSIVDRAVTPPLVPVVADHFGASIASAGAALTVYSLAYAALTLPWGILATVWGRIRVLVISTALGAVANFATALAPDLITFVIARAAAGAAFAATFTAVLVYLGDTLTMARRAVATANLAAAVAIGLAVGGLGAGLVAEFADWRWVYVGVGVACLVLAGLLLLLPEPERSARQPVLASAARIIRSPWALAVLGITLLEGTLLIGVYNYFPVALQADGASVLVAGAVTATFGLAVIVVSQLMKLVLGRWPAWVLLASAGVFVVAGFTLLSFVVDPLAVGVASGLLGMAWALGHTTIQTWMTDAASAARPIGMALFSIALFAGGSIGAAFGAEAAHADAFGVLFAAAAAASVGFAVLASTGRARYRVSDQ